MSIEVKRFLELGLKDLDEGSVNIDAGLKRLDVTITKAGFGEKTSLTSVPVSSLCTSACFSTISSMTKAAISEKTLSKEDLVSLVALHEKAVSVLGQEGVVKMTAEHAKAAPKDFLRDIGKVKG
ncbi:hypothetical protein [Enhygromyxa salina]|uniref:Uncharacterized protein n=1 Tax=Enhygromyxa salina TaxID=215803 RepID=A0A2S9YT92_9BACT|nr:hypothetical protein [Enhygromyxa salina]PRQ08304.1 hypothetical protein ENSA7_19270 [Enhygromyxa salina]